jgi:AcrR family transcriptional regulator
MPRTASASQGIRDARRATILGAARKVFARNGLAATRIGDITAEAGVSQGLFYHYFPDKEVLFTTIVEEALRETATLTAMAR